MPSLRRLLSTLRGHVRLRVIALVLILGALAVVAAPPAWWGTRGVTNANDSDDYSPINQGQLKNLVRAAVQELDSYPSVGAGDPLHALITAWATPTAQADDYAAVNVGQLKAVAKPVYDQLKAIGYTTAYPWEGAGRPTDDYVLANIGQAKNLFTFDLSAFPFTDPIPDSWRAQYGLVGSNRRRASEMAPGEITYLQKYQLGLNPLVADSAGDGRSDDWKISHGYDPSKGYLVPPANFGNKSLDSQYRGA